jgi:hypothetical protein
VISMVLEQGKEMEELKVKMGGEEGGKKGERIEFIKSYSNFLKKRIFMLAMS